MHPGDSLVRDEAGEGARERFSRILIERERAESALEFYRAAAGEIRFAYFVLRG